MNGEPVKIASIPNQFPPSGTAHPGTATEAPANPLLPPARRPDGFLRGFFFWALSLFLLGMGMKLLMLQRCLNPLPYYDQWEAEAGAIYLPYFQHKLKFADLFRPQSEHRIFFTYVWNLALLLLNRQWDAQLQMVLNAVIHCATISGFAWGMAFLLGRRYWLFIWLPLAVAVMSPFGWENALWGFQSQFYFLLLFSLLTICLLASEPLSSTWLWGLLAGACAILSMASGLLPFVAVGVVLVLEIIKNQHDCPRHLPALGWCAAFAFAGLLMLGRNSPSHVFAAHSPDDFFRPLARTCAGPPPRISGSCRSIFFLSFRLAGFTSAPSKKAGLRNALF
jgi:hypothetical protein